MGSPAGIASVDRGKVTAHSSGETLITAFFGDRAASIKVEVEKEPDTIPVTNI